MGDSSFYKSTGKSLIAGKWGKLIVICLVASIIISAVSILGTIVTYKENYEYMSKIIPMIFKASSMKTDEEKYAEEHTTVRTYVQDGVTYTEKTVDMTGWYEQQANDADKIEIPAVPQISPLSRLLSLSSSFYTYFVGMVVSVGLSKVFLDLDKDEPKFSTLFAGFRSGNYLRIVGTQFIKIIAIAAGFMLCFIPGLVLYYMFFMIDYLLAEDPRLTFSRVFEISSKAMKGYKMQLFLLDLSFIGWALLSALTFGIAWIFIAPYYSATRRAFYDSVKQSAKSYGIIREYECMDNLAEA